MAERSPRVLVLANLPPYVVGGAENQTARLIERWLALGAGVEVAGHGLPDTMIPVLGAEVRAHSLRPIGPGRPGRGAGYALRLARLLVGKRRTIDVIYSRSLGEGVLVTLALKRLGITDVPVVACPINASARGDVSYIRGLPFARRLFAMIDANLDAINLINADVSGELDAAGVTRPSRTRIPNGIALREPVRRGHVASPRRLVWTGRLEPQKRLDLLLRALATRGSEGRRFALRIVGDGSLRTELGALAIELGLGKSVEFMPAQPPESIRPLLENADVFVLPSAYEGMSNAAIEAMEAGLPVLCTRCGGVDAYVAEVAGWVCEVDSLQAIESALDRMFDASDERLLELGRSARGIVERNFDIVDVAARNLDLLRATAKRRSRSSGT